MTSKATNPAPGRDTAGPAGEVRRLRPAVKLPVRIARQMEDRVVAEGWPVGHRIGSEAGLAVDMGVCRHTLREAVRILEVSGLVESRKGKNGGLFVAADACNFACKTFSNYLEFVQVDVDELSAIHRALTHFVIDQAMAVLSQAQIVTLRRQISDLSTLSAPEQIPAAEDLHHALLDGVGNPALTLFVRVLDKMMLDASIFSTLSDEQWLEMPHRLVNLLVDKLAAILDGDRDRAFAISEAYVQGCAAMFKASSFADRQPLDEGATQRAYNFLPRAKPFKKAERVEQAIRDLIIAQGWPVGRNLGSEAELGARFGVGRSVLREALRSLEQLGVIEMGRGGRSGLRIISPDPAAVIETCRRHLRRERLDAGQSLRLRAVIEATGSPAPAQIGQLLLSILA